MKKLTLLLGTVLLIGMSMLGAACSTQANAEVSNNWVWVEKYDQDFQANDNLVSSIDISQGDTLVIVLVSNPTTGFRWSEQADISDTNVLKQDNHEFSGPESDPAPPVGAPGLESWRIQALTPGTSTVYLEYSRPWDGGEKDARTFTLNVTVK